ncbi:MAG TPA: chromate transporter [Xanthobacteraceae bacterium]
MAFATIAACGFGGVLAWARYVIVQKRRWLSPEEFNEQFALCQVLPGGNILNFAVMYGCRCAGALGSFAAVCGLVGPPLILMILAGILYRRYGGLPLLHGVLASVAAAAAGLLIATALRMVTASVKARVRPGHIVAAATFVAAGVLRLPPIWVMAVAAPVGVALAWWERR